MIRPSATATPLLVTDYNFALRSAEGRPDGVEISYTSDSRAFVRLARKALRLLVDRRETPPPANAGYVIALPRGTHTARLVVQDP